MAGGFLFVAMPETVMAVYVTSVFPLYMLDH